MLTWKKRPHRLRNKSSPPAHTPTQNRYPPPPPRTTSSSSSSTSLPALHLASPPPPPYASSNSTKHFTSGRTDLPARSAGAGSPKSKGPLSILQTAVCSRTQILVSCRNNRKLLARAEAFDRHCNMVLENAKEMWTETLRLANGQKGRKVNKDRFISKM